jgi:UDP-N-acetylmuramate dehydrogenase
MPPVSISHWCQQNASRFEGQLLFEEPFSKHTYYRIGGPARVMAVPKSRQDLHWLAEAIDATGTRYFVLGLGSNILVSDAGYDGLVIKCGRINLEIEPSDFSESELNLRTGASVAVSTLLRRACTEGWGGLEFLTGVPGSIGGVVTMNAGTHLGETAGALQAVEVLSFEDGRAVPQRFELGDLRYQYRKNLYLPRGCIVWACEWKVRREDPARVKQVVDETLARRKATQPIDFPTCGSVFKNPKASGKSAWQVVDQLGLRGHRIGGAQISEKHSNFILNLGDAKAADVQALIELAKSRARAELGIELEEEVIFIG